MLQALLCVLSVGESLRLQTLILERQQAIQTKTIRIATAEQEWTVTESDE